MGFFDDVTQPLPTEMRARPRPRPPWMKPEAAIGATIPLDAIVARTADAVVVVQHAVAYPNGFELATFAVRQGDIVLPHFPSPHEDTVSDAFLRIGILFSDGRTATNLDNRRNAPELDANKGKLVMSATSGSG